MTCSTSTNVVSGSTDADDGKRVPTGTERKGKGHFGISEEAALFVGTHRESGDNVVYPALLDFVSREVEKDANSMKQTREVREEQFLAWRSDKEDTYRLRAGQAALTLPHLLALRVRSFPFSVFITSSFRTMVRRAARDLLPLSHFFSVELHDTRRRLQRRLHRT